jgi:hypothetical protein
MSSKEWALVHCAESIIPTIMDCPKDHFRFEELSHLDTIDIDSSNWSVFIEIMVCRVDGSSETSILSLVQKDLPLIHKEIASFPNSPVVVYLKAAQANISAVQHLLFACLNCSCSARIGFRHLMMSLGSIFNHHLKSMWTNF